MSLLRTRTTRLALAVTGLSLALACVNVDPQTGETLPRGNQHYEFDDVQRRSEQLKAGMSKLAVLMLLGSPAEKSSDEDVWVYLPERPAVLVPARALRLVFERDQLKDFGYRPIILGQDL
jgi:outer membrane protein assembly factor BamE (lipoprotein component of BamABCDE complex)